MRPNTRLAFNAYVAQLALLNGVPSATEKFTVTPSVQQTLESKIQESSAFLAAINMIGVIEQSGAKLGLGIGGPVASRTNTTTTDRATKDPTTLDELGYTCKKTDFDTHITYAQLDAWAKFPDFQQRVRNLIVQRQALDRIMIGWNGTSAAASTNLATNPLLQDVNIGWLQKIRSEAPERVMDDVAGSTGNHVYVGDATDADYATLDALVYDALMLLDPWYREDPNLRVFCGSDLLHDKYFPLLQNATDPTEMLASDIVISQKRMGGKQAVTVPFFPAGKLLITTFDNLSLYWQEGGRRRTVVDNAKRDRIENFESSNDAYVVEQYGKVALVENIEARNAV